MINSPLFLLEKTHHGDTYPAMTPVNVTVNGVESLLLNLIQVKLEDQMDYLPFQCFTYNTNYRNRSIVNRKGAITVLIIGTTCAFSSHLECLLCVVKLKTSESMRV